MGGGDLPVCLALKSKDGRVVGMTTNKLPVHNGTYLVEVYCGIGSDSGAVPDKSTL